MSRSKIILSTIALAGTALVVVIPKSEKEVDGAANVSVEPIPAKSESVEIAVEQIDEGQNQPTLIETDNTVEVVAVAEGIETDGVAIENTGDIEISDSVSAEQEMVDFRMMNPGVLNDDATDGTVEYAVVSNPADWDAASQHDRLPPELLTEKQTDVVDQSVVPVLLPPDQKLLEESVFTIGDTWYAASMNEGDVNVFIQGSTASVVLPNDVPPSTIGTLSFYEVIRNYGIAEVHVGEYGVVYTVSVECFDHQTDPACINDEYIVGIVDNLLLANGEKNDEGA